MYKLFIKAQKLTPKITFISNPFRHKEIEVKSSKVGQFLCKGEENGECKLQACIQTLWRCGGR